MAFLNPERTRASIQRLVATHPEKSRSEIAIAYVAALHGVLGVGHGDLPSMAAPWVADELYPIIDEVMGDA